MRSRHVEEIFESPPKGADRPSRKEGKEAGSSVEDKGSPGESGEQLELKEEDRRRFERLFLRLDTNRDGTVDLKELTIALSLTRDAKSRAKARYS